MNTKVKPIRHGDVLLRRVDKLPKNAKVLKDKTLAYGEVTGHSHRFSDDQFITRYSYGDKLYLQVTQPSTIIHEEHNPIVVPIGEYEQITEREYDPFTESLRTVID